MSFSTCLLKVVIHCLSTFSTLLFCREFRAKSDPTINWEKWRIQVKLAIPARENITLDTLLQTKPTHVRLPTEPKNEIAIEDATEHTERDRQIRDN